MNEIIEIGAVKLDEHLEVVDTFKQMIYPHFTRKLSSRTKRLTKITNEEVREEGIDFLDAFRDFARWCSGDNVIMSWSNSDLFVMSQNFVQHTGSASVSFIHKYCDVQKYCMSFVKKEDNPDGNQIALERCAEIFGISVNTETLHRALTDCYITAACFRKVYNKKALEKYIKTCDSSFFERLLFKPYYITEEHSDVFDIDSVDLVCPRCGGLMDLPEELEVQNKAFKGATKCNYCMKPYWVFIRAKKNYDDVSVKISYVDMNKKRAKKILPKRNVTSKITKK
jgi:DNA polymerase III epsilon subunit-like protein